jgi:phage FluMu protein gp41
MIADDLHKEVELRDLTAADVLAASEAAERLMMTPTGYALVQSPTRAGTEMLKRQIARIGDLKDVEVTDSFLKGLHPDDLEALQRMADELGRAAEATADRGRGDPPRS